MTEEEKSDRAVVVISAVSLFAYCVAIYFFVTLDAWIYRATSH